MEKNLPIYYFLIDFYAWELIAFSIPEHRRKLRINLCSACRFGLTKVSLKHILLDCFSGWHQYEYTTHIQSWHGVPNHKKNNNKRIVIFIRQASPFFPVEMYKLGHRSHCWFPVRLLWSYAINSSDYTLKRLQSTLMSSSLTNLAHSSYLLEEFMTVTVAQSLIMWSTSKGVGFNFFLTALGRDKSCSLEL